MSKEKQHEYGCVVCKHRSKCEPTPFGICRDFEQEETPKKYFISEEVLNMSRSEVTQRFYNLWKLGIERSNNERN